MFIRSILILILLVFSFNIGLLAQGDYESIDSVEGLSVGDRVSDFTARQVDGSTFQLSEALQNGPVVLMFYRGQWCPVCNRYLSSVEDSVSLILQRGATLVAVSPEKPEYAEKTAQKTGASFPLLYDEEYQISLLFEVLFRPDSRQRTMYNTALSAKLKRSQSDDSQRLPVPATFIIGQNGTIVWRHFNPDYRQRASVRSILEHLP